MPVGFVGPEASKVTGSIMLNRDKVSNTAGQDRSACNTTVYLSVVSMLVSVCDIQQSMVDPKIEVGLPRAVVDEDARMLGV